MKTQDDEITLMRRMAKQLSELDELAQQRVLNYLCSRAFAPKQPQKQAGLFGEDKVS